MKKIIKYIIISIFFILVLPFGLLAKLAHVLFKTQMIFAIFGELFSLVPNYPGSYTRACYYKMTLDKSHLNIYFAFGAIVTKMETRLGSNIGIGGKSIIGLADIGDNTIIANMVSILSGSRQHNFDDPNDSIADSKSVFRRLKIGSNVFIGDQSVIMADIGDKSIIGAGSVVVKEIPAYKIAVGNPAKVVKERPMNGDK